MKVRRGLTMRGMVELSQVSRSSYYRYQPDARPRSDLDMELRDAIQRIAVEMPSYGRPRITKELRRRGWAVNAKRVYRLMREDNLLCVSVVLENAVAKVDIGGYWWIFVDNAMRVKELRWGDSGDSGVWHLRDRGGKWEEFEPQVRTEKNREKVREVILG